MAYYNDEFYAKVAPNFEEFVTKLEKLSRKYGVAVYGHYDLTDNPKEFKDLTYSRDYTSGDLTPSNYWDEE
jgi:hypothetical protein